MTEGSPDLKWKTVTGSQKSKFQPEIDGAKCTFVYCKSIALEGRVNLRQSKCITFI